MEVRFKSLEVNAFHQMGSWHLLALAFALCTSSAIAQEGQQVPKTMPAGPAITPGAAAAQGKGSGWVKLCSKNEQTGNKQLCLVKYEGLDPNTGMGQIAVAARSVEGEDKQTLLFGVTTAYTLVMPVGVQIKIDDNQPIPLKYTVCLSSQCQAEMTSNQGRNSRRVAQREANDRRCHEHAAEDHGLPGSAHRIRQDLRRAAGRQRQI